MFGKPSAGWTHVTIGNFEGRASYLDDVPFYVLKTLIRHFIHGGIIAMSFDEEGSDFIVVCEDWTTYVISERDKCRYYKKRISDEELAKEIISDFESDIDGWANWWIDEDDTAELRKIRLEGLIKRLKGLIK
jgi:hypothetical protein